MRRSSGVRQAEDGLAAQEAPERVGDARLEEARLLGVGGRDEAEQERHDPPAVDDHVQRQDEHEQHVAERPEAGDRELLDRPDELGRVGVEVVQEDRALGREVDLAEADRPEPLLPRREDRRQVALEPRARRR